MSGQGLGFACNSNKNSTAGDLVQDVIVGEHVKIISGKMDGVTAKLLAITEVNMTATLELSDGKRIYLPKSFLGRYTVTFLETTETT